MARRHRTRRARQRRRRITRRQRGGARATLAEWLVEMVKERTSFKGRVDPNRGSKQINYPFTEFKKEPTLTLDPAPKTSATAQNTEVEPAWHIDGDFDNKDVRAMAPTLQRFIGQYVEGGIDALTEPLYNELITMLNREAPAFVTIITNVENGLRKKNDPNAKPVQVDDATEYPMYFWYLMMNSTADPEADAAPILIPPADQPTPVQQEPAEQAE